MSGIVVLNTHLCYGEGSPSLLPVVVVVVLVLVVLLGRREVDGSGSKRLHEKEIEHLVVRVKVDLLIEAAVRVVAVEVVVVNDQT